MDVISYGLASKIGKQEKETRLNTLATGVQGTHPAVRQRIDELEAGIEAINQRANALVIQDAVNIMKAHAKLNAIMKNTRYQMQNMIFDDLLDLSGIDTTKSLGYTHDATEGSIGFGINAKIETKEEVVDAAPEKVILTVEEQVADYSLQFNGVNQYVQVPYHASLAPTGEVRLEIKAKADWQSITQNVVMAGKTQTGGYGISFNYVAGQVSFMVRVNSQYYVASYPIASLTAGEHVFTGSYDDYNCVTRLYIDGVLVAEYKRTGIIYPIQYSVGNAFLIGVDAGAGATPDAGVSYFNGIIDYVKVWNKATGTSGLVGEWLLNESGGTQALDTSGMNNHGTLVNSPTRVSSSGAEKTNLDGVYYISRDNGVTWEKITPNMLFYFNNNVSPLDKKLRLKAELPNGIKLLNYSLTWA